MKSREFRKLFALKVLNIDPENIEIIRTIKYPLLIENAALDLIKIEDRLNAHHSLINVYNRGSLTSLVIMFHFCGFEFYTNASLARKRSKKLGQKYTRNSPFCFNPHKAKNLPDKYDEKTALIQLVNYYVNEFKNKSPKDKRKLNAFLKNEITSLNQNAIVNLFSTTLKYLWANKKEKVMQDYGISKTYIKKFNELYSILNLVNKQTLFNENTADKDGKVNKLFDDYRKTIGGALDAWLSNTANFIELLPAQMDELLTEIKDIYILTESLKAKNKKLNTLSNKCETLINSLTELKNNFDLSTYNQAKEKIVSKISEINSELNQIPFDLLSDEQMEFFKNKKLKISNKLQNLPRVYCQELNTDNLNKLNDIADTIATLEALIEQ